MVVARMPMTQTTAMPSPAAIPDSVPASEISRLSLAIVRRTRQREAPSARSTPISRVRSRTDMVSVLMIPSTPTSTAIATIALENANCWLIASVVVFLNSAADSASRPG